MHPHDLPTIDVLEVARRIDDPGDGPAPLLLDVREEDEFVAYRAPAAALLPLSRFMAGIERIPTDRPVFVICQSGGRSASVTEYLLRSGWTEVANVRGGMGAWRTAELPTRIGPLAPGEGALADPASSEDPASA